jgi:NAD+ kinase
MYEQLLRTMFPSRTAMIGRNLKIGFVAASSEPAQDALADLTSRYEQASLEEAEVIVVLGGDGAMLRTLHRCFHRGVAVYGMHRGSVGFLMNGYHVDGLVERLRRAEPVELRPLLMVARMMAGGERGLGRSRNSGNGKAADLDRRRVSS